MRTDTSKFSKGKPLKALLEDLTETETSLYIENRVKLTMMSAPCFFSYAGKLNDQINRHLVVDFRNSVKNATAELDKQKKCAYILQEATNNMLTYYKIRQFVQSKTITINCYKKEPSLITLQFSNALYKEDITALEKRLLNINAKSAWEAKKMFHDLLEAPVLEENGAGIGLLSMMLKSHNNLKYQFTDIDPIFCTFDLTVTIVV